MLYEELTYRQIHMDGRQLPEDPNPTFMGYSVGRWEDDTLVVESAGFNDRTWLDFSGHPHTEKLRITERYRRINFGRMEVAVTFEDPGAYRKAWTVPLTATLRPDTELLEFVCNENDAVSGESKSLLAGVSLPIAISAATLDDYAGTYVVAAGSGLPFKTLRVRRVNTDLFIDADGRGNIMIVPVSETEFSARVFSLVFKRDATGLVTHAVNPATGVVLTKQP